MNYVKRILTKELLKSAEEYPIVVVLGPRQSGKTTLVKNCFKDKKYVSLENIDARDFAITDPKGFLLNYSEGAIIDEVQRVPTLLSYLQTEVDSNSTPGRFILTGSNQYMLQEKVTQSLAGRVAMLRLLPFSLSELKTLRNDLSLNEILFKGFYPKIHSEDIRSTNWLNNYVETYVDKDVRLIKNIDNLNQFNLFLKMCAARVGQLLNLVSIGNDCGIAQNTVKSWLSILESSYIIKLVYPYYNNFNKRLTKSPKIYFRDTGLLCRLLSIESSNALNTHSLKGGIFENYVFSELEKKYYNKGENYPIDFWRDKNSHEIDFLIDGKLLKLIEVKSGRTINKDYFKNINYFKKISNINSQTFLLYGGEENQKRSDVKIFSWDNVMEIFSEM